jgi:beta-mannanase
MQRIIDGEFDPELTQWAVKASATGYPLLVEFGTEVNGNWFPWNGEYNGGGRLDGYGNPSLADGPERFRDAYRHIIDICNENGTDNITWFFHVDAYSQPEEDWNRMENYYPGDAYIDWLGVSIYGPQVQGEDYRSFGEILNDIYPELSGLADKPIAVLEFAVTELR